MGAGRFCRLFSVLRGAGVGLSVRVTHAHPHTAAHGRQVRGLVSPFFVFLRDVAVPVGELAEVVLLLLGVVADLVLHLEHASLLVGGIHGGVDFGSLQACLGWKVRRCTRSW